MVMGLKALRGKFPPQGHRAASAGSMNAPGGNRQWAAQCVLHAARGAFGEGGFHGDGAPDLGGNIPVIVETDGGWLCGDW